MPKRFVPHKDGCKHEIGRRSDGKEEPLLREGMSLEEAVKIMKAQGGMTAAELKGLQLGDVLQDMSEHEYRLCGAFILVHADKFESRAQLNERLQNGPGPEEDEGPVKVGKGKSGLVLQDIGGEADEVPSHVTDHIPAIQGYYEEDFSYIALSNNHPAVMALNAGRPLPSAASARLIQFESDDILVGEGNDDASMGRLVDARSEEAVAANGGKPLGRHQYAVDFGSGAEVKSCEADEGVEGEDGGKEGDGPVTYLEYHGGGSHKFWEISVQGSSTTTRYGKVGSTGVKKVGDHGDAAGAAAYAAKMAAAKARKGYKAAAGPSNGATATTIVLAPGQGQGQAASEGSGVRARLLCEVGGSHKFWSIVQDGAATTVTFGKIGTNGSTQLKEHDSGTAARAYARKQIAAKLKKCYSEADDDEGATAAVPAAKAPASKGGRKGGKRKRDAEPAVASGDLTSLEGATVCITGTCSRPRKEVVAAIKAAGGKVSGSVTKKTTHVLLAPGGEGTSKHKAAIDKSLPLLSEADIFAVVP